MSRPCSLPGRADVAALARSDPSFCKACSQDTMNATDLSAALSNSLSLSSILILTALGLAITFGVMRVINMAHGEMLMLGAYTASVVTDTTLSRRLNLFCAIPASFLVVGFVGYASGSLPDPLPLRPAARHAAGHLGRRHGLPANRPLGLRRQLERACSCPSNPRRQPGDVRRAYPHLSLLRRRHSPPVPLLGIYLWFFKTSFGLKIRAVVQNRPMASALGISTRRVDSLTFAFATGLAGVAGCIVGHCTRSSTNMGHRLHRRAFMVVILGGLGQLAGSVAGGA